MWKQTSKKTKWKEPCCVLGRSLAAGCKWRWWGLMRGTFRLKVTRSCRGPWHSLVKEKTASQGRLLLQWSLKLWRCEPASLPLPKRFLSSFPSIFPASLLPDFHFPSLPLLPLSSPPPSFLFTSSPFPPFFSPSPPLFLFGTGVEPKALYTGNQVLYTSKLLAPPLATFLDKTEQRLTKQQLPMVGGACPRLEEAEKEGLRYFLNAPSSH